MLGIVINPRSAMRIAVQKNGIGYLANLIPLLALCVAFQGCRPSPSAQKSQEKMTVDLSAHLARKLIGSDSKIHPAVASMPVDIPHTNGAHFGATEDQLFSVLGRPHISRYITIYIAQKSHILGVRHWFNVQDWQITAALINGRCVLVSYRGPLGTMLNEEQIRHICSVNGVKAWTEKEGAANRVLRLPNGITLSNKGHFFSITSDLYDAAVEKVKAHEAALAKRPPPF